VCEGMKAVAELGGDGPTIAILPRAATDQQVSANLAVRGCGQVDRLLGLRAANLTRPDRFAREWSLLVS
jgi:hypothetical protein